MNQLFQLSQEIGQGYYKGAGYFLSILIYPSFSSFTTGAPPPFARNFIFYHFPSQLAEKRDLIWSPHFQAFEIFYSLTRQFIFFQHLETIRLTCLGAFFSLALADFHKSFIYQRSIFSDPKFFPRITKVSIFQLSPTLILSARLSDNLTSVLTSPQATFLVHQGLCCMWRGYQTALQECFYGTSERQELLCQLMLHGRYH